MKIHGIGITDFLNAYITAALWSSTDDDGNPMDERFSISDLAEDTLKKMNDDCWKFQAENHALIDEYENLVGGDTEHTAHDFWLTRNGHGSGFWEHCSDKECPCQKLANVAHGFNECNLYVGDDGKIYC